MRHIEEIIEEKLKIEAHQPTQWEVSFRLYAGWMRGGTPTAVLIDYEAMYAGYASRRRRGNCLKNLIFLPSSIGMRRGDRLISDINGKRVDKKLGVHFPFTSRKECLCQLCQHLNHKAPDGFVCDRIMEKQVDSSLVADAITLSMDSECLTENELSDFSGL
ncbi:hypothetical protein [Komagataeibacter rhaeticus]|uniref:hypothetical protein n=1 Tax=Komagataeibacter rhaeticus TaxID=215221 RepID=UPI002A6B288A|nr:hypothetical protein [Komagataeibacter rhaeticus]WPP20733.1 hypothetical protein SCD25_09650 [Komagataeibacter rhaeticus]